MLLLATTVYSCQLGRYVRYRRSDLLSHHEIFPYRKLYASTNETFLFHFSVTAPAYPDINQVIEKYNLMIKTLGIGENLLDVSYESFETFLQSKETAAFIIIQRDSILYENYFGDYSRESIFPSFSIAKSILSVLIGCAIDDGLIQSVNEPVTNNIPELKEHGFDKVRIRDLLQMTSGIDFEEDYANPFGDVAGIYFGTNLRRAMLNTRLVPETERRFNYNSGDSQLLGMVLAKALNDKSVTRYMQEKLWTPLGMEFDGSWSLDRKNGLEKTFCCINARAIDLAKFGRLMLHGGIWNGRQIVSEQWVKESTKTDTTYGSVSYFQYYWWLPRGSISATGVGGQIIYVYPPKELIMVRLGNDRGGINWNLWGDAIARLLE
jgi:CubicO group peptidase (beta-lactamase class C family)